MVLYTSPSLTRVLGYAPEDWIDHTLAEWIHPDDQTAATTSFDRALQDAAMILSQQIRLQCQDGSWSIFEMVIKQFLNPLDQLHAAGVIVNARDITMRLYFEEERQKMLQIQKALEQEKELSELKLRFFSMASHEFRTPLSTIMLAADLLKTSASEGLDAKKQRNIHRIQSAAKNLTQMLTDVLTIARAEAARLEVKPHCFDLLGFCQALLEELQLSRALTHQLSLSYTDHRDLDPHLSKLSAPSTWLWLDESLLHSILTNLISNAIKYSPPGSQIECTLSFFPNTVELAIRDQGIGIPLEDQPHLFESFHRGKNVGRVEGSGLGLTVVKKCVDLLGGKIWVESTIGRGAMFSMSLPASYCLHDQD